MSFEREQSILLNFLKNGLNGEKCSLENEKIDFEKLLKITDNHSVNMLCFDGAKEIIHLIPKDVYFDWMYLASRKMSINENLLKVHTKLTDTLEKNNIKYFVFKGLCAASYYKKPELRELGDIDFYVEYSDFDNASRVLQESGFKLVSDCDDKHWVYTLDDIELEMHFRFWDIPKNNCGCYLTDFLGDAIKSRTKYNINYYSFYGPDAVTHAVMLILHIINHIQRGGIGLRHLCDFAAFMHSIDFENNYDIIIEAFKKGGIYKTAQIVGKISTLYLGSPEFDFSKDVNSDLCERFINDVLNSGNFGNLSKESYYGSSVFTMNKSDNGGFFKSLFSFCKMAWQPCEKYKVLLIIAPIYIGFRYIFRAIRGKRPKINPVKFTKTGFSRAELYKELSFFEEN